MAKNGILIVEFANQLRDRGLSVAEAIEQASNIRLRPVVMTMIATILGGVPLVLASGAGAEARAALGWVMVGGLGFAAIATLYLTPSPTSSSPASRPPRPKKKPSWNANWTTWKQGPNRRNRNLCRSFFKSPAASIPATELPSSRPPGAVRATFPNAMKQGNASSKTPSASKSLKCPMRWRRQRTWPPIRMAR